MLEAFRQYFLWADFSFADLLSNWLTFISGLSTAAGFAVLAWIIGSVVLTLFRSSSRVGGRFSALALAIGFGVLGTAALGAGLTGLLFFPPRPLCTAALAALSIRHLYRHRPEISISGIADSLGAVSLPVRIIILCALLIFCAGVFNLEMSWDALSYHLRLPTFFLYRHKIYSVWHHYCSPFPSLIEMLYMLGLAAQGEQAVRLLNVLLGISLLLTIRSLARALNMKGELATLLLLASPLFLMLITRSYIDLGFALFFSLSLLRLHKWWRTGSRAALAESALLAGLGMSCKYVGILFLPALLAAAAPRLLKLRGAARSARIAFLWSGLAFMPLAAWLAKNWLFSANPVSPMLGAFFGTYEERPSDLMVHFDSGFTLAGIAASLPSRALALFFDDGRVDGPLTAAVGCALPLIFLRISSPGLRFLRRSVLAYGAGWLIFCPDIRFFLPAVPALCVLLEARLVALFAAGGAILRSFRFLLEASLVAGVFFAAANQWIFFGPFSLLLGLETGRSRLTLGLPPPPFHFYAREFINSSVPPGARILQISNFSSYFIERECISDFHFGQAHLTRIIRNAASPEEIERRLKRRGIGWLLHSSPGSLQYLGIPGFFEAPERDWAVFKNFLSRQTRIVWQTDGYTLFRLARPLTPHPCPSFPAYETLQFHQADQALSRGRAEEALSILLRPPALLADVGSTHIRQGDAFMLLGRLEDAKKAFLHALDLGADVPRVQIGLAQIYLRTGELPRALEHALTARRDNPRSGYAAATLALIYYRLGRWDLASENIALARRLAPDRGEYRRLAESFARRKTP